MLIEVRIISVRFDDFILFIPLFLLKKRKKGTSKRGTMTNTILYANLSFFPFIYIRGVVNCVIALINSNDFKCIGEMNCGDINLRE